MLSELALVACVLLYCKMKLTKGGCECVDCLCVGAVVHLFACHRNLEGHCARWRSSLSLFIKFSSLVCSPVRVLFWLLDVRIVTVCSYLSIHHWLGSLAHCISGIQGVCVWPIFFCWLIVVSNISCVFLSQYIYVRFVRRLVILFLVSLLSLLSTDVLRQVVGSVTVFVRAITYWFMLIHLPDLLFASWVSEERRQAKEGRKHYLARLHWCWLLIFSYVCHVQRVVVEAVVPFFAEASDYPMDRSVGFVHMFICQASHLYLLMTVLTILRRAEFTSCWIST